jgi:hypothetical protein
MTAEVTGARISLVLTITAPNAGGPASGTTPFWDVWGIVGIGAAAVKQARAAIAEVRQLK